MVPFNCNVVNFESTSCHIVYFAFHITTPFSQNSEMAFFLNNAIVEYLGLSTFSLICDVVQIIVFQRKYTTRT